MVGKLVNSSESKIVTRVDPDSDVDTDLWSSQGSLRGGMGPYTAHDRDKDKYCRPTYIPISLILILIVLVVLVPLLDRSDAESNVMLKKRFECLQECKLELVESIPEGMSYSPGTQFRSTYDAWKTLINESKSSIDIASYYWTMRKTEVFPDPSSAQGDEIYSDLLDAGLHRHIAIRVTQNLPTEYQPNPDTQYLAQTGAAKVRSLNFTSLMGAGVLHTKFWIVDNKHVYIGSANMDWRSLTQVKELGAVIYDCPCIADDLGKVFSVYWDLGGRIDVPPTWPDAYTTNYNKESPMKISLNGEDTMLYITSSPPPFSPRGRTGDLEGLLFTIATANRFIYIAVMDYYPLMIYSPSLEYWPYIDDALREAVVNRGVTVRLLISSWQSTRPMMFNFLRSLVAISKFNKKSLIEVKIFRVPSNSTQSQIPFARVNHNKYMVTDETGFIGTSNWSGDYFTNTAGVSLVLKPGNFTAGSIVRKQLQQIFLRDWNSEYSTPLFPPP